MQDFTIENLSDDTSVGSSTGPLVNLIANGKFDISQGNLTATAIGAFIELTSTSSSITQTDSSIVSNVDFSQSKF